MRRRLALPLLLALLAFVSTSAGESTSSPGATASAYAIRIAVPNQPVTATRDVRVAAGRAARDHVGVRLPADGSIVSAASTTATSTTAVAKNASAKAEADVTQLSLFKGEITADAVTARVSAGTGPSVPVGTRTGRRS